MRDRGPDDELIGLKESLETGAGQLSGAHEDEGNWHSIRIKIKVRSRLVFENLEVEFALSRACNAASDELAPSRLDHQDKILLCFGGNDAEESREFRLKKAAVKQVLAARENNRLREIRSRLGGGVRRGLGGACGASPGSGAAGAGASSWGAACGASAGSSDLGLPGIAKKAMGLMTPKTGMAAKPQTVASGW